MLRRYNRKILQPWFFWVVKKKCLKKKGKIIKVSILTLQVYILNHCGPDSTKYIPYCQASTHGRLQLKHQHFGVGGCTEKVLEWFNYSSESNHLGSKVSCQGLPNQPALSLHPCFVFSANKASLAVEKGESFQNIKKKTNWPMASFSISSHAVWEFFILQTKNAVDRAMDQCMLTSRSTIPVMCMSSVTIQGLSLASQLAAV